MARASLVLLGTEFGLLSLRVRRSLERGHVTNTLPDAEAPPLVLIAATPSTSKTLLDLPSATLDLPYTKFQTRSNHN